LTTENDYRPVDFARTAQYFTLDVITAAAFGGAFGYLERDEDVHDYIKTTEETAPVIVFATLLPLLSRFLTSSFVRRFVMPSAKDKIGLGKIMGYVSQVGWY
jgi:hypothetical protein